MSLRNLRILALTILALSISSYAQSLGDVARQVRAEKQKKGAPHTRVITNEDVATSPEPETARAEDASKEATKADAPAAASSAEPAKQATSTEPAAPKAADKSKTQPKTREERELETERRTREINRVYVDRIAAIRKQIETTQLELAKLQQAQLDNTGDFRRSAGLSPYPSEYAAQQQAFNEKIEARRNLINSLNGQLEDAKEAARHAGVPHASDL